MGLDMTTFAAGLKQHYYGTESTIPDLTYGESAFYAQLEKDETFGGSTGEVPIIHGHNQGISNTFAKAQANIGNLKMKRWALTSVDYYALATISGKVIRASRGNKNAFMEAATAEIDSTFKALTRSLAIDLFRDGYGALGVIGSISTDTVTWATPSDVMNFEVDQKVVFSQSNNGHTLRSATPLTVIARDEDAGTTQFSAALSSVSAVANDVAFREGNRENSATPARLSVAGCTAWDPPDASAITSTAFFGIDRTVDKARLGGRRVDGTTKKIQDALIDAAVLVARGGGSPDRAFISYDKWGELDKELGAKVEYNEFEVGNVGFRTILLNGPKGPIKVMADNGCPDQRGWVTQMDTWVLLSMGKPIGFLDEDDLKMLRQSTADGYEVRVGGYLQLGNKAPGWSCCVKFA